jgi:hypothetical protein
MAELLPDVAMLAGFATCLLALGVGSCAVAIRRARQAGTLAQY